MEIKSVEFNNTKSNQEDQTAIAANEQQPPKPQKLEDKPFHEFIKDHLIPQLQKDLTQKGLPIDQIVFKKEQRPVVGGECWMLYGEFENGRRFWITFNSDNIKSTKNIALAESAVNPSLLESFLIDEKKITLKLLTSRFLQRLNGQKWFANN